MSGFKMRQVKEWNMEYRNLIYNLPSHHMAHKLWFFKFGGLNMNMSLTQTKDSIYDVMVKIYYVRCNKTKIPFQTKKKCVQILWFFFDG